MNNRKVTIGNDLVVTPRLAAKLYNNPGLVIWHPCKVWLGQRSISGSEIAYFKNNIYGLRAMYVTLRCCGEYSDPWSPSDYLTEYANHASIDQLNCRDVLWDLLGEHMYDKADPDHDQNTLIKAIILSNMWYIPFDEKQFNRAHLLSRRA